MPGVMEMAQTVKVQIDLRVRGVSSTRPSVSPLLHMEQYDLRGLPDTIENIVTSTCGTSSSWFGKHHTRAWPCRDVPGFGIAWLIFKS